MKELIERLIDDHIVAANRFKTSNAQIVEQISQAAIKVFESNKKILIFGNGGSASDAQHVAAEFTGRFFHNERKPLPAIALNTDTSAMTAISNDFGYDAVFLRQLRALASSGDMVWGFSTSGNSANVLKAIEYGKANNLITVGFTGEKGGKMKEICDYCFCAPSTVTARVQEIHILASHIVCELVDNHFHEKIY